MIKANDIDLVSAICNKIEFSVNRTKKQGEHTFEAKLGLNWRLHAKKPDKRGLRFIVRYSLDGPDIKGEIEYFGMPDFLKNQYQNFTCANMEKLKKYIPNLQFSSLQDSVRDYVKNYLLDVKTW